MLFLVRDIDLIYSKSYELDKKHIFLY